MLILAAWLGGGGAAMASKAAAARTLPAPDVEIPFRVVQGNRIFLNVGIGRENVWAMLDSGASATVIDLRLARRLGLLGQAKAIAARGAGGEGEGQSLGPQTLNLGPIGLEGIEAVALDLRGVEESLGHPLPMIVGKDILDRLVVRFDWDRSRLGLTSPARYRPPPGAKMIELGREGELRTIALRVGAFAPLNALFDLGNGGNVSLPRTYWTERGALSAAPFAPWRFGGFGGEQPSRMITVDRVEIGPLRLRKVPVMLSEYRPATGIEEANVGMGVFRRYIFAVDLHRDRLIIERPVRPPPSFVRDRSGMRLQPMIDAIKVSFVSPGSPADRAGLKAGDLIVAVNSRRVSQRENSQWGMGWTQRPAGSIVRLSLKDGRNIMLRLVNYY